MKSDHGVILCTCKDKKSALKLAETLIRKKLAACVNLIDHVQSVYSWENKLCRDKEILLLIKTTSKQFRKTEQTIRENHTYSCPEIIYLPITKGSQPYLQWLSLTASNASLPQKKIERTKGAC